MAASLSITTTNEALAVNNFTSRKVIDIVSQNMALVYAIMGKPSNMSKVFTPGTAGRAGKFNSMFGLKAVNGLKHEHHYFTALDTWTPTSPGSGNHAPVALTYSAGDIQATEFVMTQYDHHFGIELERVRKIQGGAAKVKEFRALEIERKMKSFWHNFSQWINTDQNQSAASVGGWPYAINTTNTYMGVNRTTAGNENFRGNVASIGTLADNDIATAVNTVAAKGGKLEVAVCDATEMTLVQEIAWTLSQTIAVNDPWIYYPGPLVDILGVKFAVDAHAPADTIGFFDPSTWELYMSEEGITVSDLGESQTEAAIHRFVARTAIGFVCNDPRLNYKMTDV